MNTLVINTQDVRAQEVEVTKDTLVVSLADGRTIIVPLAWFPRLWYGKPKERAHFEIIGDGNYIHWPDLDEDLSVTGILAGRHSKENPESLKPWRHSRNKK